MWFQKRKGCFQAGTAYFFEYLNVVTYSKHRTILKQQKENNLKLWSLKQTQACPRGTFMARLEMSTFFSLLNKCRPVFRMISTCLVENWKPAGKTWRTSCGSSMYPIGHGSGETLWSAHRPKLRYTLWKDTRPTASHWTAARLSCSSSLATPPSTAISAMFRSTTWVSHSFQVQTLSRFVSAYLSALCSFPLALR